MDKSRNYILDRITSKKTTVEEFNFDQLQAPPLSWFFSPFDIQELHSIASSLKYSARPKERYEAIDRVCKRVGLVKFGAGTNRVVYRHPEYPDILFKIAADDVGLGDNPAEFRNQFLLKPFVAKTFEISPCGTVAIVERVVPITSREEFISVADDVFTLITEWLVGKYVLADIGSAYFLNFGTRKSFGIVLLDYPYLYELDGDKIFCKRKDPTSPTGFCDGEIDYDAGFSHLICTKCGAKYKAKELEKKIKDNELIVEREGDIKMNITISGGTNNVCKTVSTDGNNNENFLNVRASIPVSTNLGDKIEQATSTKKIMLGGLLADRRDPDEPKLVIKKIADIVDGVEIPCEPEIVHPVEPEEIVEAKEEPVVEKVEAPAPIKYEEKFVNGVSTSKNSVPVSPFIISEDIKEKALAEKDDTKKGTVEDIDNAVDTIIKAFNDIEIDAVKNDAITRAFDALAGLLPASADTFARVMRLANDILNDADDSEIAEIASDEYMLDTVKQLYDSDIDVDGITREGTNLNISYVVNLFDASDSDPDKEPLVTFDATTDLTITDILPMPEEETEEVEEEPVEEVAEEPAKSNTAYTGLQFYHASIINVKNLFPAEQPQDIIVFTDDDGNYLDDANGAIAGAYTINDQSVNATTIVSKQWLQDINQMIAEDTAEPADDVDEEDEVVESAPVGALPVNGVSTEEFLNNLEEEEAENSEEE